MPGVTSVRLLQRYGPDAMSVLDAEERRRFLDAEGGRTTMRSWPGNCCIGSSEPELYERLIAGERLNPEISKWLPEVVWQRG